MKITKTIVAAALAAASLTAAAETVIPCEIQGSAGRVETQCQLDASALAKIAPKGMVEDARFYTTIVSENGSFGLRKVDVNQGLRLTADRAVAAEQVLRVPFAQQDDQQAGVLWFTLRDGQRISVGVRLSVI